MIVCRSGKDDSNAYLRDVTVSSEQFLCVSNNVTCVGDFICNYDLNVSIKTNYSTNCLYVTSGVASAPKPCLRLQLGV